MRASLFSVLIVACTFVPSAFAGNIKSVIVPVIGHSESLESGSGAASKGDVIFSQKMVAKDTAKLSAPFFIEKNNSFDARYDLKTEALLYKVELGKIGNGYCSVDHGFSQKPKIGKRWDSQICFVDVEDDGRFDLQLSGATRKFNLSPLSLNMLWSDKDIEFEPLPYTKSGPDIDASVNVRVELSKISSKKIKFKVMIELIESDWEEHGEETISIDKETEFPLLANVYGATVQINGIENGSLSYEVLTGFSESAPIMLE